MGSYHCGCQKGYMLIGGRRCQAVRVLMDEKKECYLNLDDTVFCDSVLATNVTVGWGNYCEIYPCPVTQSGLYFDEGLLYSLSAYHDRHLILRWTTFTQSSSQGDSSEEDLDECSCANGHCVRSYLGTMCECNTGFRLDHSRTCCIDIDECAEPGVHSSPCRNARYVNTAGSYNCFCKNTFIHFLEFSTAITSTSTNKHTHFSAQPRLCVSRVEAGYILYPL
ncbi:latent-transforming growth factor beta-binding protein 3-like isoform X2 [Acanthopagrus latus]|uniref:latent-transforming growth factor beta-binding protein 3-like isoform X2 n=1 Tax=Acanthopagrus latus TaxID=8177 RepID=UPI00187D0729|nr:latent-transforming growth factor beta-binding protein 3-like isoform X2 [Acanthopagrus latus]